MFNLLAILTAIIDIQEPAFDLEDTQEFAPIVTQDDPPVMRISPISLVGLHSLDDLCGSLVAYRMDCFSEWQVGNIRAVEESKFGRVSVYFEPKDAQYLPKWRDLSELVYAVFE